jgi:DNA repair exonuclease SbcCD ATPase subunit
MRDIDFYNTTITKAMGKVNHIKKDLQNLENEKDTLTKRLLHLEQAQAFIQIVAQKTQEQLRYHIEDIVQLALDTCFPDEYQFQIKFELKSGKTEAALCFVKNGYEVDPMTASGGGVVDLASFALRIAAWTIGHTDNVIILDEPFRFLSKNLQASAGEILHKLSSKLGLQIILSTHSPDIIDIADRVFLVQQTKNKRAVVTVEK